MKLLARHRPVLDNFATKCGREGILQHSLFKTDQVFSQVLLEEQKSGIPGLESSLEHTGTVT